MLAAIGHDRRVDSVDGHKRSGPASHGSSAHSPGSSTRRLSRRSPSSLAGGDHAELSSLTASLEEVARRIGTLAQAAATGGDDDQAYELFTVERALLGALRRLGRL